MSRKPRRKKLVPAHLVPVETLCQNVVLSHHLLSDALRDMRNEIGTLSRRVSDLVFQIETTRTRRKAVKKKRA